ncbi:thiamine biosynthesis protein ThiS [Nocardioides phosphati]|uniref:Thiamine biosynthesis protein ThiS n=1 Tax=Nocardioides phosphati TaxID=1867775 RepID=A0ABQ2N9I9_9ACTN|nr:sulfur carrier protein ThiS [Nocardioides phosphati]GGO89562.1 thiamine biosynthesis protein ThiS [Nocardioides phosphati]
MTAPMTVVVNGESRALEPGATVADLLPADPRGHAVALNGTVVLRADHATTPLTEGDVVEVVAAVQGG